MDKEQLKQRIAELIEHEARSCSMEAITPLYVYRFWSGQVPLPEITAAMGEMAVYKSGKFNS